MPSKQEIEKKLRSLVDKHRNEVWSDDLRGIIQEDVLGYLSKLGVGARQIDIDCDEDGYISVFVDDFFLKKEAN